MAEGVEEARRNLSEAETGGAVTEGFTVPNMGEYALLPGNPRRIHLMASQWDEGSVKEYSLNRGYCAATGTFKGTQITAMSTGMGGPNLELPLTTMASARRKYIYTRRYDGGHSGKYQYRRYYHQ